MQPQLIQANLKKPVVIIAGNCGTGKTTTARFLHGILEGYEIFSFDKMRKEMGLEYDRKHTSRIMMHMDTRVRVSLSLGAGVIVERPHQTYESRLVSYVAAQEAGRQALLIECVCPEEVAKKRITARPPTENDNPGSFDRIRKNWEPVIKDFKWNFMLDSFVGYMVYDTSNAILEVVRIPETMFNFAEKIIGAIWPQQIK